MKPDSFHLKFQFLSLEETDGIPDFRDVKTVATISNAKYSELIKNVQFEDDGQDESLDTQFLKRSKPKKVTTSTTKTSARARSRDDSKPVRIRSKSLTMRSSTPLPKVFDNVPPKSAQSQHRKRPPPVRASRKRPSKSEAEPESEPQHPPRRRTDHRQYKDIAAKTKDENLLDLIPPDVDALGLEMDKLFLTTPEAAESDYDSVSGFSSDESDYNSCPEATICMAQITKPLNEPTSRPGQKLDFDKIGPPTRSLIKLLPAPKVYKCDKPNCCFTTSNATHLRVHCCRRV